MIVMAMMTVMLMVGMLVVAGVVRAAGRGGDRVGGCFRLGRRGVGATPGGRGAGEHVSRPGTSSCKPCPRYDAISFLKPIWVGMNPLLGLSKALFYLRDCCS
jgi:hypothetical protein